MKLDILDAIAPIMTSLTFAQQCPIGMLYPPATSITYLTFVPNQRHGQCALSGIETAKYIS